MSSPRADRPRPDAGGESRPAPTGRPRLRAPHTVGFATLISLLALTACGSDAGAAPTRAYTFHIEAVENGDQYDYVATDPIDLRVGDRVTFQMVNNGALIHDLQVVHPDGQTIATAAAVDAGATLELTVDFADPGFYRLNCNVDNHLTQHGMQAIVEVLDADGTSAG